MKTKALFLGAAVLSGVVSLSLTGCGGTGQQGDGEPAGGHKHEDGEHSHADDGHMQHMVDVKNWLKEELKDQYDEPVPAPDAEQLALGKEVYFRICFTCHGDTGKGDGLAAAALPQKPADFTDGAHARFYSDQGRIHIIKKGIEGTPMVAWEAALPEKEILAVYGYVASLRGPDTGEAHEHAEGKFVCPMHPGVTSEKPGKCPKCGMEMKLNEKEHEHGDHKD